MVRASKYRYIRVSWSQHGQLALFILIRKFPDFHTPRVLAAVMAEEPQIEEFELAYFANIPDSYGYCNPVERYIFAHQSTFGKLKSFSHSTECGDVDRRNAHIKKHIMQTYINKNGKEPPSFEIAFYDFLGDKYVNYQSYGWRFHISHTLTYKAIVGGLPKYSIGERGKEFDLELKNEMIQNRNNYIRDYLIGKYREMDDLTKKMDSAKLDDSAKKVVSDSAKKVVSDDLVLSDDSVESVDLDNYVLKSVANKRFRELKSEFKKIIAEKDAKIKELMDKISEETKETVSPEFFPDADNVLGGGDDDEDDDSDDALNEDSDDNDIDVEVCSVCYVKMYPDDDKHYCDKYDPGWFCSDCFPGVCDDELCDGCETTRENMD